MPKPSKALTVVITGASSGIGRGVAEKLAKSGANLVLAARRTAIIDELAAKLGSNVIAVTTDASRPADIERLKNAAVDRFGSIDVWINNAGIGAVGNFSDIPIEDHTRVVETTLLSAINGSHTAVRHFETSGRGILINVASSAGRSPLPFFATYSAAKFGVVGLGEALRAELKERRLKRIKVCTVNPWVTDTPWFEHAANYTGKTLRMPHPDDAKLVVKAIVKAIHDPKPTIDVGPTKGAALSTRFLPGSTERMTAKVTRKYLDSSPIAAPPTSGSLHEPMHTGRGVDGGMRERIKSENKRRK